MVSVPTLLKSIVTLKSVNTHHVNHFFKKPFNFDVLINQIKREMKIIENDEKRLIVNTVLELVKNNHLSLEEKERIFNIVIFSKSSDLQKERFIKFYNLDVTHEQRYNYTTLAEFYGCTSYAIKQSLVCVIRRFIKDDHIMRILESMIKKA